MDKYFRTTSYALVATAFMTLALTGQLDALSSALYAIALGVSFYKDARGVKRKRRVWLWRAVAIAYVPFLAADAFVLSSRVTALIHLTLFASAMKLLQQKRDRDWVFLYVVAFFQMLLAAGLTINAAFVASLIIFLFFLISTLAAFEIRRTHREVASSGEEMIMRLKPPRAGSRKAKRAQQSQTRRAAGRRRVRYLVGVSFAQIFMVAIFTLPFFFLIPRFGGGAVRGSGDSQAISGFSDKVELGQVASIKKSQRIVMRVQLNSSPSRYLRWRGVALELYDGRSWRMSRVDRRLEEKRWGGRSVGGNTDGQIPKDFLYPLAEARSRPSLIEQKVYLEPLQTTALFAAPKAINLRSALPVLYKDRFTDAISSNAIKGRIAYTVTSDISTPTEQELRADSTELALERGKHVYLQLPSGFDSQIRELARDITRSAPTAYDKAKAIENYLKNQFAYSLNPEPTLGDPLSMFLFETREGHCEYFATAMAIMLRSIGIPARIVNGFQMGEFNDVSSLYTVRESDAHSWVEVYFPNNDVWVEFDPTPSAGINDYSDGGLLALFRKYMDALEIFWLDYVITLDSEEQASLVGSIHRWLMSVKDSLVSMYNGVKQWVAGAMSHLFLEYEWSVADALKLGGIIATLCAGVLACYIVVAYRKRRHAAPTGYGPWWHRLFILPRWRNRRLLKRDRRECAVLFYEQMLEATRRAGLIKQPDQTPMEFAAATGVSQIHDITAMYNRVRFGGAELDDAEVNRIASLLAELKRTMRKKKTRRRGDTVTR